MSHSVLFQQSLQQSPTSARNMQKTLKAFHSTLEEIQKDLATTRIASDTPISSPLSPQTPRGLPKSFVFSADSPVLQTLMHYQQMRQAQAGQSNDEPQQKKDINNLMKNTLHSSSEFALESATSLDNSIQDQQQQRESQESESLNQEKIMQEQQEMQQQQLLKQQQLEQQQQQLQLQQQQQERQLQQQQQLQHQLQQQIEEGETKQKILAKKISNEDSNGFVFAEPEPIVKKRVKKAMSSASSQSMPLRYAASEPAVVLNLDDINPLQPQEVSAQESPSQSQSQPHSQSQPQLPSTSSHARSASATQRATGRQSLGMGEKQRPLKNSQTPVPTSPLPASKKISFSIDHANMLQNIHSRDSELKSELINLRSEVQSLKTINQHLIENQKKMTNAFLKLSESCEIQQKMFAKMLKMNEVDTEEDMDMTESLIVLDFQVQHLRQENDSLRKRRTA
eukprot:Awhi_evm1s481